MNPEESLSTPGSSEYLGISGVWKRDAYDGVTLFQNPLVIKAPIYDEVRIKQNAELKLDLYSENEFINYAEGLQTAGDQIKRVDPDIVLVPLTGAIRPWLHLQIYCNIPVSASCVFPFTAEEKSSAETQTIILSALLTLQDKDEIKIVCIDTAEGGQGSRALLDLLDELHKEQGRSQTWRISMLLFVPEAKKFATWKHEHENKSNGSSFFVSVGLLPLTKVIGEDIEGTMIEPKNFNRFQQAVFEQEGNRFLVETAELPAVIDFKITHAFHDLLQTEPGSVGRSVIDVQVQDLASADGK